MLMRHLNFSCCHRLNCPSQSQLHFANLLNIAHTPTTVVIHLGLMLINKGHLFSTVADTLGVTCRQK